MEKNILIEKYLAGEANELELSELKQLMNDDETLKQDVALQRLMQGIIRADEEAKFLGHINQLYQEILQPQLGKQKSNSKQEKAKVRSLFSQRVVLAIAASLTLLLVALFVFTQDFGNTSGDLYASYYQPFSVKNVRGQAKQELQSNMIAAYNSANYQQAKDLLNQLLDDDQLASKERFQLLLANCHLNLEEAEKAITLLNTLTNQEDSQFAEDAEWYLTLSYLKANRLDDAKKLAASIQANSNHLYYAKANKLLNELNN